MNSLQHLDKRKILLEEKGKVLGKNDLNLNISLAMIKILGPGSFLENCFDENT
jgi:hypothetical protein